MADAQDFVPTEAEIEVSTAYFQDGVKNFADDEEIVSKMKHTVDDYDSRFVSQRDAWMNEEEGIWPQCDAAFRSLTNDSAVQSMKKFGANEPDTWERAQTGTTQYFRQVTQKAANGYSLQSSKDMPFRYEALTDQNADSPEFAKKRARNLNLLAKWSLKKDKFNIKSIDFWTQINKYGNIPVMVEWMQTRGDKKVSIPVFSKDDPPVLESYQTETLKDVIKENRPVFTILPIESVKADSTIGNIQDQECVIVSSIVSIGAMVDGISTGLYRDDLISELTKAHQWDGYTGFENQDAKESNRSFVDSPTKAGTGQYLKREIFVNVPIDEEKEEWDESDYIPKRYRVTMFGNDPQSALIARIERNQEPDDTIPIEMIHANPDDPDYLYHISGFEVIRSNIATETTLIRQIVDNNTLVCKPPLIEVRGEVDGIDREFRPDQRYVADNINSISEFTIRDISQPTIGVLSYLKEDSNTANGLDKNMQGESFGSRTSSQEAGNIAANSARPNLVNIQYILEQLLPFVATRYKIGWETYGTKEQIVQITDENDNLVSVSPANISGEYDVVVDIVDDIKDGAMKSQRLINYAQVVGGVPELSATVDWEAFSNLLAEQMLGTSKFITGGNDGDAKDLAETNIIMMLQSGIRPQFNDAMNLKKHLEMYKAERTRWTGNEDKNPNVEGVLELVIQELEQRVTAPKQGQQQQQGQLPNPATDGTAAGQAISAQLGG